MSYKFHEDIPEDILKYAKVTRVCLAACNLQGKQNLHCQTKGTVSVKKAKISTPRYTV